MISVYTSVLAYILHLQAEIDIIELCEIDIIGLCGIVASVEELQRMNLTDLNFGAK